MKMKMKMKEVNKMSKMKKIHENYTGTIARMDEEGNLEFDFMDDYQGHPILGEYDPKEARALADAIYNDLGLGWKAYPENRPKYDECLQGYWVVTKDAFGIEGYDWVDWDSLLGCFLVDDDVKVIAFHPLPHYPSSRAPYQSETEDK